MPARLAILRDFPEENWVSMDLVAEMLWKHLMQTHRDRFDVSRLSPQFIHRATLVPGMSQSRLALNFDRFVNRFRDYPRYMTDQVQDFDLFHVADHSYAALVHVLPERRCGVFCHDLDAFRSILDPAGHRRPRWFQAMSRHILRGMQKAAIVFHSTVAVRDQIIRHGLIEPSRLVHAPLGVACEFVPADDFEPEQSIAHAASAPFVLHVGSCTNRKRIDVLLDIFASLKRTRPDLRLVKVGGQWSTAHREQTKRLRIEDSIVQMCNLDRRSLAWLYRRAAVVLFPSEAEGFGLPVIEALACGTAVVASDIPVLREVGGDAVVYCPVGDVPQWAQVAARIIDSPASAPPRSSRLSRAGRFSWANHARIIADAYERVAEIGSGA